MTLLQLSRLQSSRDAVQPKMDARLRREPRRFCESTTRGGAMLRAKIIRRPIAVVGALTLWGCVYYGPYSYYPGAGGYYACTSAAAASAEGQQPALASSHVGAATTPNVLPSSGQNCTFVSVPPPPYYPNRIYYGYPAYYYGYPWPAYYGW